MTPLTNKRYEQINDEENKNEYENFLVLPEIRQNVSKLNASISSEKSNTKGEISNIAALPPIDR